MNSHKEQLDIIASTIVKATIDGRLGHVKLMLDQLSAQNQELVSSVVRQLAEREGIRVEYESGDGLVSPAFGFETWEADLELRGFSKKTVKLYCCYVRSLLEAHPVPDSHRLTVRSVDLYLLS